MCTSMNPTGAFSLVALQHDWDIHPKNIIPVTAATLHAAGIPASIRPRPIVAMPALYALQPPTIAKCTAQVGKRTLQKNRRSWNNSARGHRWEPIPRHSTYVVRYPHPPNFRHVSPICPPTYPPAYLCLHLALLPLPKPPINSWHLSFCLLF